MTSFIPGDGTVGKILRFVGAGSKGFVMLTLPHHNPSLRKVRRGTQGGRQELKQRPRKHAAHWFALIKHFPRKPEDLNLDLQSPHTAGYSSSHFYKTSAPIMRWEVKTVEIGSRELRKLMDQLA